MDSCCEGSANTIGASILAWVTRSCRKSVQAPHATTTVDVTLQFIPVLGVSEISSRCGRAKKSLTPATRYNVYITEL